MLTEQNAVDIYKFKLDLLAKISKYSGASLFHALRGQSLQLAKAYGMSSRSIRDIWNRRSWGYATHNLWNEESEICSVRGVRLGIFDVSPHNLPMLS